MFRYTSKSQQLGHLSKYIPITYPIRMVIRLSHKISPKIFDIFHWDISSKYIIQIIMIKWNMHSSLGSFYHWMIYQWLTIIKKIDNGSIKESILLIPLIYDYIWLIDQYCWYHWYINNPYWFNVGYINNPYWLMNPYWWIYDSTIPLLESTTHRCTQFVDVPGIPKPSSVDARTRPGALVSVWFHAVRNGR